MGNSPRRAIQNCRSRSSETGLARLEVLESDTDRDLTRSMARRLVEDSADASRLCMTVGRVLFQIDRRTMPSPSYFRIILLWAEQQKRPPPEVPGFAEALQVVT